MEHRLYVLQRPQPNVRVTVQPPARMAYTGMRLGHSTDGALHPGPRQSHPRGMEGELPQTLSHRLLPLMSAQLLVALCPLPLLSAQLMELSVMPKGANRKV